MNVVKLLATRIFKKNANLFNRFQKKKNYFVFAYCSLRIKCRYLFKTLPYKYVLTLFKIAFQLIIFNTTL